MKTLVVILFLWPALVLSTGAQTNSIVWHRATDSVDADVRSLGLPQLLEQITAKTGWRVYVEPGTTHNASAKFRNLPSGDALKRLFGDLNFALVPRTNAASRLYVFTTKMENATQLIHAPKTSTAKHAPNELLVKLKPGASIDDLAKMLGAKIIGRMGKLGIYRLQFADAAAADAALGQLQNNSDVAEMDYNYYFDQPPPMQALASALLPPVSLKLNPPGDSGKIIIGLVDTGMQSLGSDLDKFILKQLSVAGDAPAGNTDITHGTAMAETILRAMEIAGQGGTSAQILPVDVYGRNPSTSSWDVAAGITVAVNDGATLINLSLGSSGDSFVLDGIIQQAIDKGILIFAAAGNEHVSTPFYPAADPGVIAVTALQQKGQLASYANYGSFVDLAAPGSSVVYLGNQPWLVQGTSVSTAYMTGMAAGTKSATGQSWTQIQTALSSAFQVPSK